MKRALVLSGGGTKGSYQIGVWKALKKLNIKIDIVTGTSIGSLNAVLFAQNNYITAKNLWLKVKTNQIFDIDIENNNKEVIKKIITEGGVTIEKGEQIINQIVNEKKLRKSKIKYGLVTYSYKNKQPKMMTIDQIPNGKLKDYVLASCALFPIIQKKKIDNDVFIDGGYYDNLPINLATEMGADEIIAVDLNGIGIRKKTKNKDIKIDLIKSKSSFPGISLTMNQIDTLRRMALGYNDTMKYYKKLDGEYFTFYKNELDKNYQSINKYYIGLLKTILLSEHKNKIVREIFNISKYNKIFNDIKNNKEIDSVINESLEYLGETFNLEDKKIYKIKEYNKKILREVKNLKYLKIGKNLKGKMLIGYIYNKYINEQDKTKLNKELFNFALIFPKEFLATLYLISISNKYPLVLLTDEIYNDILNALKK